MIVKISELLNSLLYIKIFNIPFIIIWVIATGIFCTVQFKFINFRLFKYGIQTLFNMKCSGDNKGIITHIQAFATVISGTVGLGTISGVAIAITIGGPSAIFWMIITGMLGMSIKFAEVVLAFTHRSDNTTGGAFYYMKHGLAKIGFPKTGKFLAFTYAIMLIIAMIFGGIPFQANQMAALSDDLFKHSGSIAKLPISQTVIHEEKIPVGVIRVADTGIHFACNTVTAPPSFLSSQCVTLGSRYKNICELCNAQQILGAYNVNGESKIDPSVTHWDDNGRATQMIPGNATEMIQNRANYTSLKQLLYERSSVSIIISLLVLIVILGGIKRIAFVATSLAPIMIMLYIGMCVYLIYVNKSNLLNALSIIFQDIFSKSAIGGGVFSGLIAGVRRSVFANEAGTGTAAIAHSTVKEVDPIKVGCVAMIAPFIDTILISFLTGIVIIITGMHSTDNIGDITLISSIFSTALPLFSKSVFPLIMFSFAFSTIIAYCYYSEVALLYLFGNKKVLLILFQIFIVISVYVSCMSKNIEFISYLGDTLFMCLMIPNTIAIYLLRREVLNTIDSYYSSKR